MNPRSLLLVLLAVFSPLAVAGDEPAMPERATLALLEIPGRPAFGVCAAYYFLAARGHPATRYDELYTSGEFSLNSSTLLHGPMESEKVMETTSGVMMREIDEDWRKIAILDKHYANDCAALLRDAGYSPH
jgi:hypothetical protein